MTPAILTDDAVKGALSMRAVVKTMRLALRERAHGSLVAPPRWSLDVGRGELVFTAGAAMGVGTMGFRAYETLGRGPGHSQLVGVWNAESGRFDGCIVGDRVGLLRTAGLNGAAAGALARTDASRLGVLGTGPQARQGARAVCAVRDIEAVDVYSPTADHRETFAERMPGKLDAEVVAHDDPEPVVRGADVVYCATDSESPVFEADWLDPGTHVHTLGPKWADGHERLVELGDLVVEGMERAPDAISVFCSVGLAGTEVVLADRYLREAARDGDS
jgi:alanine dehydrogenase